MTISAKTEKQKTKSLNWVLLGMMAWIPVLSIGI